MARTGPATEIGKGEGDLDVRLSENSTTFLNKAFWNLLLPPQSLFHPEENKALVRVAAFE